MTHGLLATSAVYAIAWRVSVVWLDGAVIKQNNVRQHSANTRCGPNLASGKFLTGTPNLRYDICSVHWFNRGAVLAGYIIHIWLFCMEVTRRKLCYGGDDKHIEDVKRLFIGVLDNG